MTFGPIAVGAGERAYFGSQDGRVYEWDLGEKRILSRSLALAGYVRTIAILGETGWLAFAAEEGPVWLWQPHTGAHRTIPGARTTTNLLYDASRKLAILGTAARRIESWDLLAERLVEAIQLPVRR